MNIGRPQQLRLIDAAVLLIVSLVFMGFTRSFNRSMSPAQPNEDTHSSHNVEGEPQLVIENAEQLRERFNRSIVNSITAQLYSAHYKKSSKLEREAELVKLQEKGKESTTITVKFLPSGDEMTAEVTVNNAATNDFDIRIEGEKDE